MGSRKVYCIIDGGEICSLHRRGYNTERSDYLEHVLNMEVGQAIMCGPTGQKDTRRIMVGLHRAATRLNMMGMQRTRDGVVYFIRKK